MKRYLTLREYHEESGHKVSSLRNYIKMGMPCYRTGKRGRVYRVVSEECELWFEEHFRNSVVNRPQIQSVLLKVLEDQARRNSYPPVQAS